MVARSPLNKDHGADADPSPSGPVLAPAAGQSLREIFEANVAFVWRTLRHFGVSEADVEDVCQEVFVVVHRKLSGFEGRSALRTWLYGICFRVAKDHRSRAYMRREIAVSEPPPHAAPATQETDYARAEARLVLDRILDMLDEDKRAVFVLYEIEGLPMREVAEVVGCPLQTAYSRLQAARKIVLEAAEAASGVRRRG